VDPAQIVGNDVAALLFDGGLVPGAANRRRAITKADRGEAAELGTDARVAMTRGIKVSAANGPEERAEAMASYVIVK